MPSKNLSNLKVKFCVHLTYQTDDWLQNSLQFFKNASKQSKTPKPPTPQPTWLRRRGRRSKPSRPSTLSRPTCSSPRSSCCPRTRTRRDRRPAAGCTASCCGPGGRPANKLEIKCVKILLSCSFLMLKVPHGFSSSAYWNRHMYYLLSLLPKRNI